MIDWNQIVADHGRRVFVLAQRVLGNAADAEEIAQEVLVEAYRLAQLEPVRSWPGLLGRLATHRALDRLRQRRPTESIDAEPRAQRRSARTGAARELATRLRGAIDTLPRQQAAAFCLRYFDDLSYDDIATALGIDNGAAATAIYKARQRLRAVGSRRQGVSAMNGTDRHEPFADELSGLLEQAVAAVRAEPVDAAHRPGDR